MTALKLGLSTLALLAGTTGLALGDDDHHMGLVLWFRCGYACPRAVAARLWRERVGQMQRRFDGVGHLGGFADGLRCGGLCLRCLWRRLCRSFSAGP